MTKHRTAGFTLIELLAVIAIIGILAAIVTVAAPGVLERARITDVESDFSNIRTALTTYYADTGSYPPAYGYRRMSDEQIDEFRLAEGRDPTQMEVFFLEPYMQRIQMYKAFDLYDRFSVDTHDTNANNGIDLLEYHPVGTPNPANPTQFIGWSDQLYVGNNNAAETARMLAEQGPYIYIPVNLNQAKRYARWCYNNNLFYAEQFNRADPELANITFPPPKYDAFVLISVGPQAHTRGLLPSPLPGQDPLNDGDVDGYHILGLRAYFLATRDANGNGLLDFDYRNRLRQGENASAFSTPSLANLPDGSAAPGPLIFKHEG